MKLIWILDLKGGGIWEEDEEKGMRREREIDSGAEQSLSSSMRRGGERVGFEFSAVCSSRFAEWETPHSGALCSIVVKREMQE